MARRKRVQNLDSSILLIDQLKQLKDVSNINEANDIIKTFPESKEYITKTSKVFLKNFVNYIIQNLDKKYLEEAFKLINHIYSKLYTNTKTLDSILSKDVRKPVLDKYGNKEEYKMSKNLVKISFADKGKLIEEGKAKVFDKNSNRLEFTPDSVLSIISKQIQNLDPLYRAVALLISSGCRPIELFERANFVSDPEMGPNWVIQDYVAKRKEKLEEPLRKPIIYFKANEFIEQLHKMRYDLHQTYPSFVDKQGLLKSVITGNTNLITKELFEYKEGVTQYTTRKIYGAISFDLYSKTTDIFGSNPSYNVWLNNVLGHSKKSFMTSHNYSHISLKNEEIVSNELAIKQDILENKIEAIEDRLNDDNIPQVIITPPTIAKENDLYVILKRIYDKHIENNNKPPSQTMFEELSKNITTRGVIRKFYKKLRGR